MIRLCKYGAFLEPLQLHDWDTFAASMLWRARQLYKRSQIPALALEAARLNTSGRHILRTYTGSSNSFGRSDYTTMENNTIQ